MGADNVEKRGPNLAATILNVVQDKENRKRRNFKSFTKLKGNDVEKSLTNSFLIFNKLPLKFYSWLLTTRDELKVNLVEIFPKVIIILHWVPLMNWKE